MIYFMAGVVTLWLGLVFILAAIDIYFTLRQSQSDKSSVLTLLKDMAGHVLWPPLVVYCYVRGWHERCGTHQACSTTGIGEAKEPNEALMDAVQMANDTGKSVCIWTADGEFVLRVTPEPDHDDD